MQKNVAEIAHISDHHFVLDIYQEFGELIAELSRQKIAYAVIGGFAMAVHGYPRATEDIDILGEQSDLDRLREIIYSLGYTVEALPMSFRNGTIQIRRFSKIDDETGDMLSLDIMLDTPEIHQYFEERVAYEWEEKRISVLSRKGMIALKKLRNNGIDQDDIAKLEKE